MKKKRKKKIKQKSRNLKKKKISKLRKKNRRNITKKKIYLHLLEKQKLLHLKILKLQGKIFPLTTRKM